MATKKTTKFACDRCGATACTLTCGPKVGNQMVCDECMTFAELKSVYGYKTAVRLNKLFRAKHLNWGKHGDIDPRDL